LLASPSLARSSANGRGRVLVLENHRHTLAVVRSLSVDYDVVLGVVPNQLEDACVASSNAVTEVWSHPPLVSESFVPALKAFLRDRHDVVAVYPVGDDAVEAVSGLSPGSAQIAAPSPSAVSACRDKDRMAALVDELGVRAPESAAVASFASLRAFVDRHGLPCIVKPLRSDRRVLGKKCLFLEDECDLMRLSEWPDGDMELLAQTRIPGDRYNGDFVARDGTIVRWCESRVLRTDVADGSGYGVDVVSVAPSRERRDNAERLVARLNYSGIGVIQHMVGARGSFFLEINPRTNALIPNAIHSGLDLPRDAVRVALDQPLTAAAGYRTGVRSHWLYGDLRGAVREAGEGSVAIGLVTAGRLLRTLLLSPTHVTWSRSDPRPTLSYYCLTARDELARLGKRLSALRRRSHTPA
jgi:predicted ATP-grasp superfamily ATP-dependent carboligase